MRAEDLSNDVGKVLRLRDDGTILPDNPFVGRANAKPEVYTYGHRNVYGLAWDAQGTFWATEIVIGASAIQPEESPT
jgi:glucose/arabinose dehydrogenase